MVLKTLYIVMSAAAGVFFTAVCVLDCVLVLDYRHGEADLFTMVFLLCVSLLLMAAAIGLIIVCNRKYDEGKGIVRKRILPSRWAMTSLLAGMIASLTVMSGYEKAYSAQRSLLASPRVNPAVVLILACISAVALYVMNYHRFLPRLSQVERAQRRSSLNGRRFVFLREEKDENGRWKGILKGEIHKGDRVCIIYSDGTQALAAVSSLYVDDQPVSTASDCNVSLKLKAKNLKEDGAWTVVSGQRPEGSALPVVSAENPRISAMLEGLNRHYETADFMSCFIYDCVHGEYLVPAKVKDENEGSGDITEAIRGSHDVMFLSVSSSREPEKAVFPLFTDWDALERYQNVMADEKSVVLLMSFQQAVEMMHKGYDGMVINPFGPASFFLSRQYVHSITSLEGYRQEFVNDSEEQ